VGNNKRMILAKLRLPPVSKTNKIRSHKHIEIRLRTKALDKKTFPDVPSCIWTTLASSHLLKIISVLHLLRQTENSQRAMWRPRSRGDRPREEGRKSVRVRFDGLFFRFIPNTEYEIMCCLYSVWNQKRKNNSVFRFCLKPKTTERKCLKWKSK